MCNCKATEIIIGAIILIFALLKSVYSDWIIIIAAIIIIIHAMACKNCGKCMPTESASKRTTSSKKKTR